MIPQRLVYVPLEAYKERYTEQLSRPITGWWERNWRKIGLKYGIVSGQGFQDDSRVYELRIKTGEVLDATWRSQFAISQIKKILEAVKEKIITEKDVIYFDDFWHPGIEALAYQQHQLGIKIPMYAYCWAQSIDKYDFTHAMRKWIRHYERGNAAILDGIFVANTKLKKLLHKKLDIPNKKIHVVGLPFCSEEVLEHFSKFTPERNDQVVFSSRFDREKDPMFFLDVVEHFANHPQHRGLANFVYCTSAKEVRSNYPEALKRLKKYRERNYLTVLEGLSKELYYDVLRSSKIQLNTAKQDWVSFTLLEAITCGCRPVYPNRRSFPETFGDYAAEYLYEPNNVADCVAAIIKGVDKMSITKYKNDLTVPYRIVDYHNDSWKRILDVIGLYNTGPESL